MKKSNDCLKSKLLLYAHYYSPDVASTGQILQDLAEGMKDVFDITVICTVPSYSGIVADKYKQKKYYYENINDVNVVRIRVPEFTKSNKLSRIKNIISYFFGAINVTKKLGKFDYVYTISQPPILGGLLGVTGKRITKGKLIYNIQDFNPEQVMAVNYSKNKLILKLMMYFDKKSCRKSDLVITVGRDMQQTLYSRFKNKKIPKNVVINNWINEKEVYPLDKNTKEIVEFKKKYNINDKFVIMYSGNIGLYYDLENIFPIIDKFKEEKNVVFAFVGDGSIKKKLENISKEKSMNNVVFIPYQDKKDLIYSLNAADVHLVTNAKGIKGVSVPSKIYGCLATNVPVLGILENDTEAYKIIQESNCGIIAETGNYKDIETKLSKIIKEKYNFVRKHSTGRKYLEEKLTKDKSIEKYISEIEKI